MQTGSRAKCADCLSRKERAVLLPTQSVRPCLPPVKDGGTQPNSPFSLPKKSEAEEKKVCSFS